MSQRGRVGEPLVAGCRLPHLADTFCQLRPCACRLRAIAIDRVVRAVTTLPRTLVSPSWLPHMLPHAPSTPSPQRGGVGARAVGCSHHIHVSYTSCWCHTRSSYLTTISGRSFPLRASNQVGFGVVLAVTLRGFGGMDEAMDLHDAAAIGDVAMMRTLVAQGGTPGPGGGGEDARGAEGGHRGRGP